MLVRNVNSSDVHSIIGIVELNNDVLRQNNLMIYYLCCTVFAKYSFIAFDSDNAVGFIFAFPSADLKYIWIHQIAIDPDHKRKGIGAKLMEKLEAAAGTGEYPYNKVKLAVKPDNLQAMSMYEKLGYRQSYTDKNINMEIFEKVLR